MIKNTPAFGHKQIKPLERAFSEWPLPTIEYPESDGEPLAETDFQHYDEQQSEIVVQQSKIKVQQSELEAQQVLIEQLQAKLREAGLD